MAIGAILAGLIASVAGAGNDPARDDLWSIAIEANREWARLEIDRDGGHPTSGVPTSSNCLIKLAYLVPIPPGHRRPYSPDHVSFDHRAWINQNGHGWKVYREPMASKGHGIRLKAGMLTRARVLVAALPATDADVEPARAMVVGSLHQGTWEVRTYDPDRLPAEVASLIEMVGISYPE